MLLFSHICHTSTNAEVIFDGSIHNEMNGVKMEGNIDIKSDYGQINGSNLYHSFRTFNINKNETATFSGPNSIENIITRVTGDNASLIDGVLQSRIPDANFYLLNPSGVIFGKNASLKLGGSFHVSTADYIKMNNNDNFYVDTQKTTILSSAKPSAFGFIDDTIADISILENIDSLQVNKGKTISLIGGNIVMNNGSIKVEEGRINIASIHSAGEIEFVETGIQAIPIIETIERGTISIINSSEIDVSGAGSGNIFIIGGELILDYSEIVAKSKGSKDGGITHINVDNFFANNNGNLRSDVTSNENKGGRIRIQAKESVWFQNVSKISTSPNGSFFNVKQCHAGNIDIAAKSIFFDNQSSINSDSYNAGNSGNISLIASEKITFSNFSTIFTSTTDHGNAGNIDIQANNIYFTDGSGPGSQTNGTGKGGNIHIVAKDSIVLHGIDGNDHGRNITSYSGEGDYGHAGDVWIQANTLVATNNAGVVVGTKGSGNGGSFNLEINQLKLDHSVISSQSTANTNGGAAGKIRIGNKIIFQDDHSFTIAKPCNKISLVNNAKISTDSVSSGGGIIDIKARQLVCLSSHISTNVYDGSGKGGDININDIELIALNHSHISANAVEGDGGAIFIHAEHFIKSADSLITATSERGNDGSVTIEAPDTDVEKGLGLMAADFLDATQWMNNNCNIHSLEQISRFSIQGKKAIPEHFNDLVASPPFILEKFKYEICQKQFEYATQFFYKGDYENAAETFENLISTIDISTHIDQYCAVVMYLIPTFQALGFHDKCFNYIHPILPKLENQLSDLHNILIYNLIGDLYLSMNDVKKSVKYLSSALKFARSSKHPAVLSSVMNNCANAFYVDGKEIQAINVFRNALTIGANIDKNLNPSPIDLQITIRLNLIFALTQTADITKTCIEYQKAEKQINAMPKSYQKASKLFQLCSLAQEIKNRFPDACKRKIVNLSGLINHAETIATEFQNMKLRSRIHGFKGRLLEKSNNYSDAIHETNQAIFFADLANAPEILYLWQWQLGRLHSKKGDFNKSISLYKTSIQTLNPIRKQLFQGIRIHNRIFETKIKPVYLELTGLILKQAKQATHDQDRRQTLINARNIMEQLKTAEIQDYFQDECLTQKKSKQRHFSEVPPKTAVIYPVPMSEHLSIILELPDNISQISVPVSSKMLEQTVRRFRNQLEDWDLVFEWLEESDDLDESFENSQLLKDSREIYQWLIQPIEKNLRSCGIETLVIVPDGSLRLIPFSALNNGQEFLIKNFAVVTSPAIQLTDTQKLNKSNNNVLLNGLSSARHGFIALPGVSKELDAIKHIVQNAKIYKNENYTVDNFKKELNEAHYSIVHLATHGYFGGTPQETFILAYDKKLTMNQLEKIISLSTIKQNYVDLLILSACQTAKGNERAAFGLAGVALKAGVKSAVATLWTVDDKATSVIINNFYEQINKNSMSKAKALQFAQNKYMDDYLLRHPSFWAPFLLIGNWL